MMLRRQGGFTLIELLLTSLIVIFVIAGASDMFVGLLSQFKQQSKIVETNIEGIVGLELMRRDIENAGYGLPWNPNPMVSYNEVASGPGNAFNDAPTSPPRAILSGNNTGDNGSDRLVIKSINVEMDSAGEKWTFLTSPTSTNTLYTWSVSAGTTTTVNLENNDRVIVLRPGTTESNSRELVPKTSGTGFAAQWAKYTDVKANYGVEQNVTRVVYGVHTSNDLRMPFNRADYYLNIPASSSTLPERCAKGPSGKGTGIIYKAVVSQDTGAYAEYPILDCVADMQVVFKRDTDNDGTAENTIEDLVTPNLTAQQIRDQVREVRVYILAQEGQKDRNYTYPSSTVRVGETGTGRDFDLSTNITDWRNYRWKLYTMVVKPNNLR